MFEAIRNFLSGTPTTPVSTVPQTPPAAPQRQFLDLHQDSIEITGIWQEALEAAAPLMLEFKQAFIAKQRFQDEQFRKYHEAARADKIANSQNPEQERLAREQHEAAVDEGRKHWTVDIDKFQTPEELAEMQRLRAAVFELTDKLLKVISHVVISHHISTKECDIPEGKISGHKLVGNIMNDLNERCLQEELPHLAHEATTPAKVEAQKKWAATCAAQQKETGCAICA